MCLERTTVIDPIQMVRTKQPGTGRFCHPLAERPA